MNTTINSRIVQPYLFFGGRCEEALEFYRQALGAKTEMLMRYSESPEPTGCPADWAKKVMHASVIIGETTVMVSDGCWEQKQTTFQGFALSLSVPNEAEADRHFAALAKGGQVHMPLDRTFFSRRFGMVADRFGVLWMVIVPAEMPEAASKLEAVAH